MYCEMILILYLFDLETLLNLNRIVTKEPIIANMSLAHPYIYYKWITFMRTHPLIVLHISPNSSLDHLTYIRDPSIVLLSSINDDSQLEFILDQKTFQTRNRERRLGRQ